MVQRYEQMRRLQWYKRGAAYECSEKIVRDSKRLRIYTIVVFSFVRTFAP